MRTITTLLAAASAIGLSSCAYERPELQTGVQCVKTTDGKAYVEAGLIHTVEGRCVEWRIGPTRTEQYRFENRGRLGLGGR
ncbi:hypothetical protein ACFPOE_11500 [Caenimonas terrae]|uniref:DUF333 domain-containing protein n=1 Tax=Caenimonas terrae TaxID=696074 RepID=A0ABW0NDV3_9BURK